MPVDYRWQEACPEIWAHEGDCDTDCVEWACQSAASSNMDGECHSLTWEPIFVSRATVEATFRDLCEGNTTWLLHAVLEECIYRDEPNEPRVVLGMNCFMDNEHGEACL